MKVAKLVWAKSPTESRYKTNPIIGKEFMVVNYGHGWRAYGFPLTDTVSWADSEGTHLSAEAAMDALQGVWDEFVISQLAE